jgi:hypothetical protein
MIKLKNKDEFLISLNIAGTASAATDLATFVVPFACKLKAIYARYGTAGTTSTAIYDVNKNNTTIFGNATKVSFASTSAAPTYGTFTVDPTSLAKDDVITVDCDQINTTPGKNFNLNIVLKRSKSGSPVPATVTGGLGTDAE